MEGAVACPLQLNAARNVGPVVARFFFFFISSILKEKPQTRTVCCIYACV